jgi:CPA1 family monovalent cation:H+ antiporter
LTPINQFDAIYNILILVTIVTLVSWRLQFSPTIAFIIAGTLASLSTRVVLPELSSEIFISLLLPPILFQETLHLDISGLINETDSILGFAIIGTLLMQLSIAAFTYFLLGFNLIESLLFGILIAPTDPVAVIRTFHDIEVDKRFQTIISGESLFNDGIAIVLYSILISIISKGSITISNVLSIIFLTIIGGIIIGLISGYLVHSIYCWTNDRFAEVLVSFITAFGIFRIAEELGASGVLAIVVSGLLINYRSNKFGGLGEESYNMLETLWEFIGFLASSIAFIFIGMNLEQKVFLSYIPLSFVLLFIILSLRFVMVETISYFLSTFRGKYFSRNWKDAFLWSGLRGAISIVLVLGVTGLVPHSSLMTVVSFGIVILSNVIQGFTMGSVIKGKGLVTDTEQMYPLFPPSDPKALSEEYNPEGYVPSRGFLEKILFSAPEFFIQGTWFGSWLSRKLVSLLSIINRHTIDRLPVKTVGRIQKIVSLFVDYISRLLGWINHYLLRKEVNNETKHDNSATK